VCICICHRTSPLSLRFGTDVCLCASVLALLQGKEGKRMCLVRVCITEYTYAEESILVKAAREFVGSKTVPILRRVLCRRRGGLGEGGGMRQHGLSHQVAQDLLYGPSHLGPKLVLKSDREGIGRGLEGGERGRGSTPQ
jgi:hypothetical protein